ncbi:putative ribonuclease H-like domain-containing protein [Tanacetum coccineum]
MVRAGHAAYTGRFHELARLVPYLVTPKSMMIKRYVYDLASQIRGMVAATEPKTIQKAMHISGALTDEAVKNGSIKKIEKRGNVREPSKDKNGRDDNKRTRVVKAFATTTNPVGRENTGIIEPSELGFRYVIEIDSGQIVAIDMVFRGCKLDRVICDESEVLDMWLIVLKCNQVNDRFKKSEGYHAVPPPFTGNFKPARADLSFVGLDDFIGKAYKRLGFSAPIIEDWESDSEDENVFEPKEVTKTVKSNFEKIEFVKCRNSTVEKPRKLSQNPRDNKRNGNSFEFTNKACFVCGSFNHLIKDYNFHDKKMVQKPVLNNVKKGTAVLTKSGIVPISASRQSSSRAATPTSAARPINTAAPKPFGNPQYALQDQGIFDSGCSRHMTGNKFYLSDYQDINGGFVAFGGSSKGGKITGKAPQMTLPLRYMKMGVLHTNQEKLYLLHMDLCVPMRVASINGKKDILVIVDDYSRFTWVKFLASKDEARDFIIKFLKMIQVRLNTLVRNIRTDNGTEFVNQTLRSYYESVGISHETSVARSPQQNGVFERPESYSC